MTCKCSFIKLNGVETQSRNYNPDCPVHALCERCGTVFDVDHVGSGTCGKCGAWHCTVVLN